MISTTAIQSALKDKLKTSSLFEKVMVHSDSDLGAALSHLRDNPSSIAVIVPGADSFSHQFEDDEAPPVHAVWRCKFDIIISGRQLDKRETGDPKTLVLKDDTLNLLFWSDLDVEGLITLPEVCEPIAIEFENGKGREAWKLTVDLRQIINPS
jgi:hypothetical protein